MGFSILERIVGVETAKIGKWEGNLGRSFSILERIVGVETAAITTGALYVGLSFSILERIVGVETICSRFGSGAVRLVSVSSNGSLGLKLVRRREPTVFWVVSVSSNGSLGLKPSTQIKSRSAVPCFSILERIVGVETVVDGRGRADGVTVSVSSNGSLGLKQFTRNTFIAPLAAFQYPRTDRWG